ncbi:MAG: ABC transporter ATP-binding protein, partial [Oscillospiraceae bacterium]|nr:ABC transporter ATP-binding protein [Oscillospiraceae bacterium]
MELLQVKNLSFAYPKNEKRAIDDVSFNIEKGSFNVVFGESGCGKTTLLKLIKKEIAPYGELKGSIIYNNKPIDELPDKLPACEIGFVGQNPDGQIVTDKVWHELAFGLENMGESTNNIRRRVGEMASYFGIQNWYHRSTDSLSGGQKQLLNLASVMAMQPKLLLLDEPTSQLDPIAAADFIATLQKLNREFGLTILLVEHRLEEVFPIADK